MSGNSDQKHNEDNQFYYTLSESLPSYQPKNQDSWYFNQTHRNPAKPQNETKCAQNSLRTKEIDQNIKLPFNPAQQAIQYKPPEQFTYFSRPPTHPHLSQVISVKRLFEESQLKSSGATKSFLNSYRKCISCREKIAEYLFLCYNHVLCNTCFEGCQENAKYLIRWLTCFECRKLLENLGFEDGKPFHFYDRIKEFNQNQDHLKGNLYKAWESKNFNIEENSGGNSIENLVEIDKNLRPESINLLDEKGKDTYDGMSSQSENFSCLDPVCQICNFKAEVVGFICNHNICVRCFSLAGIKQIEDYEKNSQGRENRIFSYRCPLCQSLIDIPTRMIFRYLEKTKYFAEPNFDRGYFESFILPRLAFYDGINP